MSLDTIDSRATFSIYTPDTGRYEVYTSLTNIPVIPPSVIRLLVKDAMPVTVDTIYWKLRIPKEAVGFNIQPDKLYECVFSVGYDNTRWEVILGAGIRELESKPQNIPEISEVDTWIWNINIQYRKDTALRAITILAIDGYGDPDNEWVKIREYFWILVRNRYFVVLSWNIDNPRWFDARKLVDQLDTESRDENQSGEPSKSYGTSPWDDMGVNYIWNY
jgi:hypothetical protein